MNYAKTNFGMVLKGMVDRIGLEKVLLTLASVCDEKAEEESFIAKHSEAENLGYAAEMLETLAKDYQGL